MRTLTAAAVQMNSGREQRANLVCAEGLVRDAAGHGARLVALPENFSRMAGDDVLIEGLEPLDGPTVRWGRELARELSIDLLLGSIPERAQREGLRRNTSVLIAHTGEVRAAYRKIHLFDIDLPGLCLRESLAVEPGAEPVVAEMEWGRGGLSVCYDLRFPELYRRLVLEGAEVLAVPSAFTATTGADHWELLLRARAVENQCYVVAPAQVGRHSARRVSWGHAAIIDPWGEILADAGDAADTYVMATLDGERLVDVRRRLPVLDHLRLVGGGPE